MDDKGCSGLAVRIETRVMSVASMDSHTEWLDYDEFNFTVNGFTVTNDLTAMRPAGKGHAESTENINISFQVSGLGGGESTPFHFYGSLSETNTNGTMGPPSPRQAARTGRISWFKRASADVYWPSMGSTFHRGVS